jgi:hypothetical protein
MKQTAVEWLVDKLKGRSVDLEMPWNIDLVEQAKEMEKQQIINARVKFNHNSLKVIEAEQYYNETFKTKQNDTSKQNVQKRD